MPYLDELQRDFAEALRSGESGPILPHISGRTIDAADRIAVHLRHTRRSLTRALSGIFPVTVQIVGDGFFEFAADAFIRAHPPTDPCLSRYGELLANFLNRFAPSSHLAYLPDLVRLEWMLHVASLQTTLPSVNVTALAAIGAKDVPRLTLRFQPGMHYLTSAWAIDQIYLAHNGPQMVRQINADEGPVWLQIYSAGFHRLSRGDYRFRDMLTYGASLELAHAGALLDEPDFDVQAALGNILNAGLVTGFLLPLSDQGDCL